MVRHVVMSTPAPAPILEMAHEILDKIMGDLDAPEDRLALASACRSLLRRYYIPAMFDLLCLHALLKKEPDSERYFSPPLFFLSPATKGSIGFKPFFISSLVLSPDRKRIEVRLTSPCFDKKAAPTRSFSFVNRDFLLSEYAEMQPEYTTRLRENGNDGFVTGQVDVNYWEGKIRGQLNANRSPLQKDLEINTNIVDWETTMAGKLVPADYELINKRFKCKECNGLGIVHVSKGLLRRYVQLCPSSSLLLITTGSWPDLLEPYCGTDLDDHPVFELDCPVCEGYKVPLEQLWGLVEIARSPNRRY